MNIFVNLPFEFLKNILLFSFWYYKIYIYDCSYITFMIIPIINKNNVFHNHIFICYRNNHKCNMYHFCQIKMKKVQLFLGIQKLS